MNNFELQMTIWKLINPVPANCDSRPADQWQQIVQLAVSSNRYFNYTQQVSTHHFKQYPAIYLFDELIAFLPR
jgi:hypothetical protein